MSCEPRKKTVFGKVKDWRSESGCGRPVDVETMPQEASPCDIPAGGKIDDGLIEGLTTPQPRCLERPIGNIPANSRSQQRWPRGKGRPA